jgi:hypothetical protein
MPKPKVKKKKLFNRGIHDNLLDLGYHYAGRQNWNEEKIDMYDHRDNDDWFGINKQGHIDPLDYCEFTEGSVKGRASREEWQRTHQLLHGHSNSKLKH